MRLCGSSNTEGSCPYKEAEDGFRGLRLLFSGIFYMQRKILSNSILNQFLANPKYSVSLLAVSVQFLDKVINRLASI